MTSSAAAVGTAPGSWLALGESQRNTLAHLWGKASKCLTLVSSTAMGPDPVAPSLVGCRAASGTAMEPFTVAWP